MKVVFAALGAYGHLFPMLPLALACRDAGHDVVVATGAPFLDRLPVRTVPGLPAEVDLAWAEHQVRRRHPDLHGFEATLAMFGDVTAGATVTTMLEVLDSERADLLIDGTAAPRRRRRRRPARRADPGLRHRPGPVHGLDPAPDHRSATSANAGSNVG